MEDTKGRAAEGVGGQCLGRQRFALYPPPLLPSRDRDTEHSLGPSPVPSPPRSQPWWGWTLPLGESAGATGAARPDPEPQESSGDL